MTVGKDPEALIEMTEQFEWTNRTHPRRGKLDCERHTVETAADLAHQRCRGGVQAEVGPHRLRSFHEQLDRLETTRFNRIMQFARWHAERQGRPYSLAGQAEGLA